MSLSLPIPVARGRFCVGHDNDLRLADHGGREGGERPKTGAPASRENHGADLIEFNHGTPVESHALRGGKKVRRGISLGSRNMAVLQVLDFCNVPFDGDGW
jgi:hypothetical protein